MKSKKCLKSWGKSKLDRLIKIEKQKKEMEHFNYSIYFSGLDKCVDNIPVKEISTRFIDNNNSHFESQNSNSIFGKYFSLIKFCNKSPKHPSTKKDNFLSISRFKRAMIKKGYFIFGKKIIGQ